MAEGGFEKTDGDIYFASEVNNQIKQNKNTTFFNSDTYMGFGRSMFGQHVFKDDFTNDSALTKTNMLYRVVFSGIGTSQTEITSDILRGGQSGEYVSSGNFTFQEDLIQFANDVTDATTSFEYDVYNIFDECDNSSINTTNFDISSGATEGGDGIKVVSGTASALRTSDLSSHHFITTAMYLNSTDVTQRVDIEDGSGNSTLLFRTDAAQHSTSMLVNIDMWINFPEKHVFVAINGRVQGDSDTATVNDKLNHAADLSYTKKHSLTGWDGIKLKLSGAGNGSVYYVRAGNDNPSTTQEFSISSDAGSNFTQTANGAPTKIGDVGSSVQIQCTGSVATGEVAVLRSVQFMKLA